MKGYSVETLKKNAIDAISKLPDTASIDDIMYRLYVIGKIHKGKEAVSKGETISLSELKKEVAKW
jgi:hypothetical protein